MKNDDLKRFTEFNKIKITQIPRDRNLRLKSMKKISEGSRRGEINISQRQRKD